MKPDTWYSSKIIANILSVHPQTVNKWFKQGKFKAQKIGIFWITNEETFKEIKNWWTQKGVYLSPYWRKKHNYYV